MSGQAKGGLFPLAVYVGAQGGCELRQETRQHVQPGGPEGSREGSFGPTGRSWWGWRGEGIGQLGAWLFTVALLPPRPSG